MKYLKLLLAFTSVQLIIVSSYSMDSKRIDSNLDNKSGLNNNDSNEFIGRKRNNPYSKDEIQEDIKTEKKDEIKFDNQEDEQNIISNNTFVHTYSFDPNMLGKKGIFFGSLDMDNEFDNKYGHRIMNYNTITITRKSPNFTYEEFIKANDDLKKMIQIGTYSDTFMNQTNIKEIIDTNYPILYLQNLSGQELDITNGNIKKMVKQIGILLDNLDYIMRDRFVYMKSFDKKVVRKYNIEQYLLNRYNHQTLLNIMKPIVKGDEFNNVIFNNLQNAKLINNTDLFPVNDNIKDFCKLYDRLISLNNKFDEINIVEQFYSMVMDKKVLFSLFNEILLRDESTFNIINKLLMKCLEIQSEYPDIIYGGITLIHQTILNTIDKYFIKEYSLDHGRSKEQNKYWFEKHYNEFLDKIFKCTDSFYEDNLELFNRYDESEENFNKSTLYDKVKSSKHKSPSQVYLKYMVFDKYENIINDINDYIPVFCSDESSYTNGYNFFNNLSKFIQNNFKKIDPKSFNEEWIKEENTVRNSKFIDSAFEKLWISYPKTKQLKEIIEKNR